MDGIYNNAEILENAFNTLDSSYEELERDYAFINSYSYYPTEEPRDYGSYDYFDCVY